MPRRPPTRRAVHPGVVGAGVARRLVLRGHDAGCRHRRPARRCPAPEATGGSGGDDLAGPGGLVRRSIDATPVGPWTGAAAALLPLGIWLLVGVTGSSARGLPSLRLPPFPD